jgi:hypothetical protein
VNIRVWGVVALAVALPAFGYVVSAVPRPVTHGSHVVASDREKCVAPIGPSFVQFSVYRAGEPSARYCKEIPEVGLATIVIDQGDAELREMTTDVRIIKDVGGGAGTAELTSEAIVAPEALDPVTEKHVLPERYPTGIIEFAHRFTSPGLYHAMVTAKNDHGQVFVSEFPFRVGPSGRAAILLWGGVAAAFIAAALALVWNQAVLQRLWSRRGHG